MRLPALRRTRGALLRLTLDRRIAIPIGVTFALPGVTLAVIDFEWESWFTDGCGLVVGAMGVALLAVGVAGRRPDWIDPSDPGRRCD
ncbi:MAG: hypothetical protein CL489_03990 [Acidobacteria bacterium]|jgi:hypothetical protein|nr:hypothetical protein [Acidobacteriota bacterium]MBF83617.1 hypothetical protein [Acidobacteriota bacterium]MCH2277342.1 hypothetical protein [Vicinamibacterales bacterium]